MHGTTRPGRTCRNVQEGTAGRVAREARCGWLYITHLYPATERLDIEAEVRKEFSGPLTIASDGLVIEF